MLQLERTSSSSSSERLCRGRRRSGLEGRGRLGRLPLGQDGPEALGEDVDGAGQVAPPHLQGKSETFSSVSLSFPEFCAFPLIMEGAT